MPPVTATQIESLLSGHGLKRDYVAWDKISPNVRLAVLASEDQLFPVHKGFDWKAIEKSMKGKRLKKQKIRGAGSSTISQQTAKNVFLWQGTGLSKYIRKGPEFVLTKLIEWVWGKKRILHVYTNVIETGEGVFGFEAAAQKYFNKPADKLSVNEAAMITASLPNPKIYTVKPMSRRVCWRYKRIVKQMNNLKTDPKIQALIK